jgi:hypothetical protein
MFNQNVNGIYIQSPTLQSPLLTVTSRIKTQRVSTCQVKLEGKQRAALRLVKEGGC